MAAVAVLGASLVNPTNETDFDHRQYIPAATIAQGNVCIWDTNRKIIPTAAAPAAKAPIAGIALRSDRLGGQAITLLQRGFVYGYDCSALAANTALYAGATGTIDTAGNVTIGAVLPMGSDGVLMAYIDVTKTWGVP